MSPRFKLTTSGTSAQYMLINDEDEYQKTIRELRNQFDYAYAVTADTPFGLEFYNKIARAIKAQEGIDIKDYKYVIRFFQLPQIKGRTK